MVSNLSSRLKKCQLELIVTEEEYVKDELKNQSSFSRPTWNGLPDVVVRKIFGQLKAEERARFMVVSKSWKRILCRDDLPTASELWRLSSFTYKKSSLIKFISTTDGSREYAFKLPELPEFISGVWCCGLSSGWLVIASKPKFNPNLFLWNPLTDVVMPLPSLSTLPFLPQLLESGPQEYNISSYMKRVVIFSRECVVAVVFSDPDDDDEQDYLALCTPKDRKWRLFERDHFHSLSDILFHDDKLYALAKHTRNMDDIDKNSTQFATKICLSKCQVHICVLRLDYNAGVLGYDSFYNNDDVVNNTMFKMTRGDKISEYLVKFSGQLLVVAVISDLFAYNNIADGPVKTFRCHQIQRIKVLKVDGLEKVESLGDEQTIALADTGSFTMPSAVFQGDCDGCIYFTIGYARAIFGDQYDEDEEDDDEDEDDDEEDDEDDEIQCVVREYGIIHLETNEFRLYETETFKYPGRTICGWHTPKLF